MSDHDLIFEAAGLYQSGGSLRVDVTGFAPFLPGEGGRAPRPAILVGTWGTASVAARAWPVIEDPTTHRVTRWDAVAFVTAHPGGAVMELTEEERERLRGENLTPSGMDKPVGQEAAIRASETPQPSAAPPYAPPLQALDGSKPPPELEPEPLSDVDLVPASCGGAHCFALHGDQGVQEQHDPNTCPDSAEADRG